MGGTIQQISAVIAALAAAAAATAGEPAKATDHFTKIDSMRVHYESLGRGASAVVFVHGWTCDLNVWRFQAQAFGGKTRLLLVDLPGHGQSDKPEVPYTMDLFARSVDAVMKDAGVEHAVLVGHSMGTPVARQFYRLFPAKTLGLVAVDGALRPYFTDPNQIERVIAPFAGPDFKASMVKMVDGMFTPGAPASLREVTKATMLGTPQHVAVSAFKGMLDPEIWKEDKIDVPLLVVLAKSPFWSDDYEAFVRGLAPQVDYRVMEGVGHFLMLEKPAEFNEILTGFLEKQGLIKPQAKP